MAGRIELLDYDPMTGGRTLVHFDQDGDGFVIENKTDVTNVAELALAERNAQSKHPKWKDGIGSKVAVVPTDIYLREVVGQDMTQKDFLKWLDDKDKGGIWRTRPGRLA